MLIPPSLCQSKRCSFEKINTRYDQCFTKINFCNNTDIVDLQKNNPIENDKEIINNENIKYNVKSTWSARILSGSVCGRDYKLEMNKKIFKPAKITGYIDNQEVFLEKKYNKTLKGYEISGNIGDKDVNLIFNRTKNGRRLYGDFNEKSIDVLINTKFGIRNIKGNCDNKEIDFNITNKGFTRSQFNIDGEYSADKDFLPLLFNVLQDITDEETAIFIFAVT